MPQGTEQGSQEPHDGQFADSPQGQNQLAGF